MTGDPLASLRSALAGRHALERELGRGGMATIYLARDLKHDRLVALKVLRPELAAALGPERFVREITLTAGLDHPHILALLDSGEASGFLYYTMPFVEGESLRDRLTREKQLPLDDALQIAREVADALGYAHSRGVVHRDIKPENILLAGGHARVADFGIATALTAAGGDRLTETGIAVGTPAYMSPEQGAGSRELDGRTDLYSLGCVLYEMLAGHPPFTGATAQEVLARHSMDAVPLLSAARPTVPEHVERAITTALAKVPADRFATADRLSAALEAHAAVWPRWRIPTRAMRWSVMAVAVGAVIAIGGWALFARTGDGVSVDVLASRVAVFPFAVHAGSDLAYLGDAVAGLLGDAVNGVGELRCVDQHAVVGQVEQAGASSLDRARAQRLARRLGAGRYLLGTVTEMGPTIRVSASLYDLERGPDPVATEAQEGTAEAVGDLVAALAQALLIHLPLGPSARLENIAPVRAANPEALRAYLDGESFLWRGESDSAKQRFLAAVAYDSTFALAWYRLTWAQDWTFDYRMVLSADRAVRWSGALSSEDRALAEIAQAYAHGDRARLEPLARRAVDAYPDLADAWWYLGVAHHWHSWQWGRSPHRALEFYRRAAELEPFHRFAYYELTWFALMDRDARTADSLIRLQEGRGISTGGWKDVTAAMLARSSKAPHAWEQVVTRAAARPSSDILRLAGNVLRFSDRVDDAASIYELVTDSSTRPVGVLAEAHWGIGRAALAGGRWRYGTSEFDHAERLEPGLTTVDRVLLAALPFLERPQSELRTMARSLSHRPTHSGSRIVRPDEPLPSRWTIGVPPELAPHLSAYLQGLLSARLADEAEALRHAAVLERAREPADSSGLLPDLALEIRALAAIQAGHEPEALDILDRSGLRVTWHYEPQASWIHRRPLTRMLRAELLFRAGRLDEAAGWYGWFGVAGGLESLLLAPVFLRRGQIAERSGRREEAIGWYRRFVTRWQDADTEYQPLVQDARSRIARLSRSGSN